jgi:hypothetical protein
MNRLLAWLPTTGGRLATVALLLALSALGIGPDPMFAMLGGAVLAIAPFPVQPTLTAIAVAYRNTELIADSVLPRVPVGAQDFKYLRWTQAEHFTVPNTRVGRRSQPNEVEFTATETSASCDDYGLDYPVPQQDIDNAPPNYDPVGRATEGVADLIELDREIRAAGLVFGAGNYAAANKATLSGTGQWSDFTNSDPVTAILNAFDAMLYRPNVAVLGQAVWTRLSTHPKVCKAIFGNNTDAGIVSRQAFAALLELDEVLVGRGWYNTAVKGQTASLARVWGKHAAFVYRNSAASSVSGGVVTYGMTAQYGTRIAGAMPDMKIGAKGGQRVRVVESVKELMTANDLGYLFTNAVA